MSFLDAVTAPAIQQVQTDYEQARDHYRTVLNSAAALTHASPSVRQAARTRIELAARDHRLAFHAQQIVTGGPLDLSDPRD